MNPLTFKFCWKVCLPMNTLNFRIKIKKNISYNDKNHEYGLFSDKKLIHCGAFKN